MRRNIIYPDVFYYKVKNTDPVYSHNPPGKINVERLIAGQPYWEKIGGEEEKPKSLILADWTAGNWSGEKIEEVKFAIRQLLKDGFSLYLWQENGAIPLNEGNLSILNDEETRNKISPDDHDDVIAYTKNQYGLAKDQMFVMDDYWLQAVTDQTPNPGPRQLDASQIMLGGQGKYGDKTLSLLKKSTPPLQTILDSEFYGTYEDFSFIEENLPNIPIVTNYKSIELIVNHLADNKTIQAVDLSEIEKVKLTAFRTNYNWEAYKFAEFIAEIPHVKTLVLQQSNDDFLRKNAWIKIEGLFSESNSPIHLPHLTNMTLHKLKTSEENLTYLLEASPNIKRLEISDLEIPIKYDEKILDRFGRTIEDFEKSDKSENFYRIIMREHPTIPEKVFDAIPRSVESLTITGERIHANSLLKISKKADKLKSLDLTDCYITALDEPIEDMDFKSLVYLNLSHTNMLGKHVSHILSHAENLESLIFSNYKMNVAFKVSLTKMNLKSLINLDLHGGVFSAQDVIILVQSSPNLKFINMDDAVDPDDPYYVQLYQLLLDRNIENAGNRFNFKPSMIPTQPSEKITTDINQPTDGEYSYSTGGTPVDPVHKPSEMLNKKPTDKNFSFQYKGENKTLNQGMVIEKFSQYLTLMNAHLELLPKINDGMCSVLAELFIVKNEDEWVSFLSNIHHWDGKRESLDESLISYFKEVQEKFIDIYVDCSISFTRTYLGDKMAVANFLQTNSQFNDSFILSNPWHDIAIKYIPSEDKWQIYDPNFVGGHKTLSLSKLTAEIEKSLGTLVLAQGYFPDVKPIMTDVNQFIKDGGLLALYRATEDQAKLILNNLNLYSANLSYETLKQGLMIRSNSGHPAWAIGIHSNNPRIKEYVSQLLEQLSLKNSNLYAKEMANSIAHLSKLEKHVSVDDLTSVRKKGHTPFDIQTITQSIHEKTNMDFFEKRLTTWKNDKPVNESTNAFCQRLVNGLKHKQLIKLPSTQNVLAAGLAIEHYCQRINRPVFYIHSPNDLVCSSGFITKEGQRGKCNKGPGGVLHDFLMKNNDKSNPPVLIVNYDRFTSDDIVRLNSLLDKSPKADGTPLPESAIVIGLINPQKPGCCDDESFYSRFGVDNIESCSLSEKQLLPEQPHIPDIADQKAGEAYTIDLYHAVDWKERLLGRWTIQKDHLYFKKGLLEEALQSGLPIEIKNGLWDNPSFCHFWNRAFVLNQFNVSKIPLYQSEGYDWDYLKQNVTFSDGLKEGAIVLNPTLLSEGYQRYECDNTTHQLDTVFGLIRDHENKTLDINVTRDLNDDQLAELLSECKKYNVRLNYHTGKSDKPAIVIKSTDVDVTVSQITENENWLVIDVSELNSHDLLGYIDGKIIENSYFEFTEYENVLAKMLDNNQNIILKGRFSPELADGLAPYLLDKINNKASGKLLLISDDVSNLNYVKNEEHLATSKEKYNLLIKEKYTTDQIDVLDIESESFSQLQARLVSSADPWIGMRSLSSNIRLEAFDPDFSFLIAAAFVAGRVQAVNDRLEISPYTYLTGLTAVGKSTFVETYLASQPNTEFYSGTSTLEDWAKDQSDQRKILFIDEANITSKEWSEFEGLFSKPRGMWINRTFYPLSDHHKVIFAGNPLSYGGGRKLAPFFERHGNAVLFKPMPSEFIYEAILKPIFKNTPLENQSLLISHEILKIYQYLCECSTQEVLISPRELQMMALLVLSHADKYPKDDLLNVSQYYAYLLAHDLVPIERRSEFEKKFKMPTITIPNSALPSDDYILTPSREPLYHILNDLTALSEFRRRHPEMNEAQLYGGLGGIVVEGEPGIGKSELIYAQLKASHTSQPSHHLPISMQTEDKNNLLLHALDEGASVVIDEINSAPIDGRLHNAITMGKKPNGERPEKPGFHYRGTQNPPTMGGRHKADTAVKRRRINYTLPPYPDAELKTILMNIGLDDRTASDAIAIYQKKLEQANNGRLTPRPTQRDLFNAAEEWVKGFGQALVIYEKDILSQSGATLFVQKSIPVNENPEKIENRFGKK